MSVKCQTSSLINLFASFYAAGEYGIRHQWNKRRVVELRNIIFIQIISQYEYKVCMGIGVYVRVFKMPYCMFFSKSLKARQLLSKINCFL